MAKPAIKRSYVGPWTPENRDQFIDRLVKIAGELPAHQFEIEKLEKDEVVTYSGSAREKLHDALQRAHRRYRRLGDDGQQLGTTKQLLKELRRIENTAHRLLVLVGHDTSAMRSFLGLERSAAEEVEPLRRALRELKFMGLDLSREISPLRRLRTAIEGVDALHRWAKAAAEENLRRIARMHPQKAGSEHARHKGDAPLNRYIETVVKECWCGVWERQISDGPKLWRFVVEAAAGIGVPLSEDASRERIRRIFSLRRANRSGLDSGLPSLQTSGSKHRTSDSAKRG
jgi:hypothetical protein